MAEAFRYRPSNRTHDMMRALLSEPGAIGPISHLQLAEPLRAPEPKIQESRRLVLVELTGSQDALDNAVLSLSGQLGSEVQISHAVRVEPRQLSDAIQEKLQEPEPKSAEPNGTRDFLERLAEDGEPMGKAYQYLSKHGGTAPADLVGKFAGVPADSLVVPGVINMTEDGKLYCPHIDSSGVIFTPNARSRALAAD